MKNLFEDEDENKSHIRIVPFLYSGYLSFKCRETAMMVTSIYNHSTQEGVGYTEGANVEPNWYIRNFVSNSKPK